MESASIKQNEVPSEPNVAYFAGGKNCPETHFS